MRFRLSGLNGWHDCQRKVAAGSFRDQIRGLDSVLNVNMNQIGSSVGTACHTGVEALLRAKLNEKYLSVGDAQEQGVEELKKALSSGEMMMDDATGDRNEAIDQVSQIISIYNEKVLPIRTPKIIEERFNHQIGEIEFSGQIDLQTDELNISDLKTSKHVGIYYPQLGGYSLNMKANKVYTGPICEVVHIPRLKKKHEPPVNILQYSTVECERVAQSYKMQISSLYERFLEEQNPRIFKANPSSTLCSEKYCPAYGTEFCDVSNIKPEIYLLKDIGF